MKKTFAKKDLKNGDIVITRGGEPGVVILDKQIIIYKNDGYDEFDMYTDDLMSDDDEREWDIMQVYQGSNNFSFLDYNGEIPVFVREEEPDLSEKEQENEEELAKREKQSAFIEPQEVGTAQNPSKNMKKTILIVAQAFYGNRTITEICEDDIDRFILGYLTASLPITEKIDRSIIHIPGSDNIVFVYNKYKEEKRRELRDRILEEDNKKMKPLAVIPEMDLMLYSRCIACRMNEDGEFESLEDEDFIKFMQYLTV